MPQLENILYSGQISEGEAVREFESKFASFIGHPHVLSFYSGTAALHAALIMSGVGPGDDVVSTPMTAEPTNLAIKHAGANVVWADVDPVSGNVTPESIRAALTPKTKALMIVHYGGEVVDMGAIYDLAQSRGLRVIEDAAHALGARYNGQPIGLRADYVMYSLQAIKHMTTVDGGMLTCRNPEDLVTGRKLRWFGIDRNASRTEVDIKTVGYKYHMNNVNATIGIVQLGHIAPVLARHRDNGRFLDSAFPGVPGVTTSAHVQGGESAYWFYTVLAERRDDLSRHLTANGIGNSMAHKRNDWHSLFADSRKDLPGVTEFYSRMLHIPCGWWVSDEDRARIVECFRRGW